MKYFLVAIVILICAGCGNPNELIITTTALPAATGGNAYSQTLTAVGGIAPYSWSITSGTLPAGLALSTSGVISGTPSTPGISTFTVNVVDSSTTVLTSSRTLSIQVVTGTVSPLSPGQSITLVSGQSVVVPSGTTIQTPSGSTVTVTGDLNTINTSAGAIVSVPTAATGPADNTVIAN